MKVTPTMQHHVRALLEEVKRQGGDYVRVTWLDLSADGDGKAGLLVSGPAGHAHWKEA